MHVIVLGRCYYAGLHRGVPRDHEGLEVEGGAPSRLHHTHQSTPGRRGSACKVLFTRYTHVTHRPQSHFIIVEYIQNPVRSTSTKIRLDHVETIERSSPVRQARDSF